MVAVGHDIVEGEGVGGSGLEADEDVLVVAGVEEFVVDVDEDAAVDEVELEDFFLDTHLAFVDGDEVVAAGQEGGVVGEGGGGHEAQEQDCR